MMGRLHATIPVGAACWGLRHASTAYCCNAYTVLQPMQVLEVTEQLLRQTDLLSDISHKQLPADSLAGIFLHNLGDVLAQQPELGSVIR